MLLNMSGKWRPFCLSLNVLTVISVVCILERKNQQQNIERGYTENTEWLFMPPKMISCITLTFCVSVCWQFYHKGEVFMAGSVACNMTMSPPITATWPMEGNSSCWPMEGNSSCPAWNITHRTCGGRYQSILLLFRVIYRHWPMIVHLMLLLYSLCECNEWAKCKQLSCSNSCRDITCEWSL